MSYLTTFGMLSETAMPKHGLPAGMPVRFKIIIHPFTTSAKMGAASRQETHLYKGNAGKLMHYRYAKLPQAHASAFCLIT